MCFYCQFHHLEAVILKHGGFGACFYIGDQTVKVGKRCVGGIDIFAPFCVDKEQMVCPIAPSNIDIFAKLDIAFAT